MEVETVNLQQLKREARYLMDTCFWASDNYWSTCNPKLKKNRSKTRVRIAYLDKTRWFGFVFSKFHHEAVDIFRSLEGKERFFYQEPINRYKSFSVWCIDGKHFQSVLAQMQELTEVEVEFVVPQSKKGLCVPAAFLKMNLRFQEVGNRAKP